MKRELLAILRCPHCRGELHAAGSGENEGEIDDGELHCAGCRRHYPVVQGVPRLLLQDGLVARTRSGFTYQWNKRQTGRAERRAVVYGYEIGKFMDWFVGEFTPACPRARPAPGCWMPAAAAARRRASWRGAFRSTRWWR
ncbi:Trm112p-like protein [Chromobacterium violaceum]|uniref:Trm112p-like protein n=1 Tax=Chromobacterium violaceum TaxID=536 RepID=A0A3S5DLX0_CHRVL|nr:Trm112p-like protein [Chromobacterium violaceum]